MERRKNIPDFFSRLLYGSFEPRAARLESSRELAKVCFRAIETRDALYFDEKDIFPLFFKGGYPSRIEKTGILYETDGDYENTDNLEIIEISNPNFQARGVSIRTIDKLIFIDGIAFSEVEVEREFTNHSPDSEPINPLRELGIASINDMTQKIRELTIYSL